MEYPLSITSLIETFRSGEKFRAPMTHVTAQTHLGPFANFGSPAFFHGTLTDATEEQILYFKYAPEVEALFRGSRYRFESIDRNGSFRLVRTD